MLAFRITSRQYSHSLFASGIAGRWNSSGRKVIYASESIPLAFLENMIRRKGVGFNSDFQTVIIALPDSLDMKVVTPGQLPDGWRDLKNYSFTQSVGDKWFGEGKTAILKVPSAVLPDNCNYVLNTLHPDYNKISIVETTDLVPDERIEKILKQYRDI